MGIPGWRVAFHIVGLIGLVVGLLVHLFARDPRSSQLDTETKIPKKSFWSETKNMVEEAKQVIKIPSFQVIIAQGVSGSFPWSAMSFYTMWLELIGFSHQTTALLWTTFRIAIAFGALFGGKFGDILAKHFPNTGRIIMSQLSVSLGAVLVTIMLLALPYDPSTTLTHGLVFLVMGLMMPWCETATNRYV